MKFNIVWPWSKQVTEQTIGPKVFCRDCKHTIESDLHPDTPFVFAKCAASVYKKAFDTTNYVSGEVTHYDVEYHYCSTINSDGDCLKFERSTGVSR